MRDRLMLERFLKLFSRSPGLSNEARAFVEKLAPSYIWILAVGIRGTHASPGSDTWETIAEHVIELADIGDDDSVFPFNYRRDGRQILPFFSSEDCARQF